jgi:hypothetical protein
MSIHNDYFFKPSLTIVLLQILKMKKYIFAFVYLSSLPLCAQDTLDTTPALLERTQFKVGYYGNIFWVNGLHLGAEYQWKEKNKTKEKRRGQKTITRQRSLHGSLGFATNFSNQTDNGLTAYIGHVWRRTNPKGWQLNLELNPLGYYRSFLPDTYEVKGEEVSKVSFPGRSYYAPSFAFGIGKDRREKRLSGWYLNFNCTLRTPYNAGVLPTFSLQYGYRFNFNRK